MAINSQLIDQISVCIYISQYINKPKIKNFVCHPEMLRINIKETRLKPNDKILNLHSN